MIEEKCPEDFDDEEEEKLNEPENKEMLDELFGKDLLNHLQKPQDIPLDPQSLDMDLKEQDKSTGLNETNNIKKAPLEKNSFFKSKTSDFKISEEEKNSK